MATTQIVVTWDVAAIPQSNTQLAIPEYSFLCLFSSFFEGLYNPEISENPIHFGQGAERNL